MPETQDLLQEKIQISFCSEYTSFKNVPHNGYSEMS